jgi:hypothetical protein
MPSREECPHCRGRDMKILTPQEKEFLDVFLHEATTSPFSGPATRALHSIGAEYGDISYLAWAYQHEVPRTSHEWGHAAAEAPPLPWPTRIAVRLRDEEIRRVWEETRQPVRAG